MNRVRAMIVAVVLAVGFLCQEAPTQGQEICSWADQGIAALSDDINLLNGFYNTGWNLLEYQVTNGYVTVGSPAWDDSMAALTNYQNQINQNISDIDYLYGLKRTANCPM